VLFIPPAQPWRNGNLERFHWTMQREYWASHQPQTRVEAQQGLLEWLHYYNTERPHSSLKYEPPAKLGTYVPLGGEVVETPERLPPQAGAISFIRMVESGGLVDCQGAICRVAPVLVGQYVTVRCVLAPGTAGEGVIHWTPKKDTPPEEVGHFRHYIDRRMPKGRKLFGSLEFAATVAGVPGNEGLIQQQYDRRVTRHLKKSYGKRGKRMQQAREDLAAEEA
jgi:hypothetical protein